MGPSLFADPRLGRSLAYGAVTVGLVAATAAGLGALTRATGLPVVLLALWAGFLEPLVVAVLGGGAGVSAGRVGWVGCWRSCGRRWPGPSGP